MGAHNDYAVIPTLPGSVGICGLIGIHSNENDEIRHERSESETERGADSGQKHEKEQKKQVEVTVSFHTMRHVSVSMDIYDLATGSAVWGGVMEESDRRRNSHTKVFDKDERWKQVLIEAVVEEILMGKKEEDLYPEPMSLPKMLEAIFSGFARNMPAKGS